MAKNRTLTPRSLTLLPLSFLLLALCAGGASAKARKLLYTASASRGLREVAAKLRNLKTPVTPAEQLTRQTDYFVRIAPRRFIFEKGRLKPDASLGGRPFVFVTTPRSVYGLSLLDIYLGIGYEAEDVIRWQRDEDMVMIVFRYPDGVARSDVKDGRLPDDWDRAVYAPTWANVFALFRHLASAEPGRPSVTLSREERDFVLGFPAEAKQRIAGTPYAVLKSAGGDDWRYRSLLEGKLSVFEHFRGDGRTQNEVRDPEGVEPGLIEFVGPNRKLTELPEVAIIHLGKLTMKDNYGARCSLCRPVR